ncbi:MAG: AAA family ATPase [Cyanobacteria bacterium J06592_8]
MLSTGLSAIALGLLPASPFSLAHWALGLTIGDIIGIIFLVVYSLTFSLTAGTARGIASGSVVSVTAGVANATVLAVVLGRSPDWSFTQVLTLENAGLVILFGFFVGTSVVLTIGGISGGIIGVVTGLASGLIAGAVFGIISTAVENVETSSLIYASIIGLATSGAFGASMTFASGLMICLAMGIFVGFSIDIALYQNAISAEKAILYGGIATFIIWIGTLRLIPLHIGYLLYTILKVLPGLKLKSHPIAWDELIILPLPGTQKYLKNLLHQNRILGLLRLTQIARNPLLRPIAQRTLKEYLSQAEAFLPSLYRFLNAPVSQSYIFAPVDGNDWKQVPASKQLLLGELSSQWVNCTSEYTSYQVERFIYGITWLQRDHVRTSQTAFYHLIYDISYSTEIQAKSFKLSNYAPVYSAFENQLGGTEISQSFDVMAKFLSYTHISHLAEASKLTTNLPSIHEAIRPDVIDFLNRLKQLADDITIANQSNSLLIQQASLLRANSTLEGLHQSIRNQVVSPEFKLLQKIVKQWSHFVREAGGETGQLVQNPSFINNPYIIGTPVTGKALIGREDILRRIADELFATPGHCPSIVLYGHRRMGKSSILRSLSGYLSSSDIKVVDFNMQILGHISNTGELLYALSRQICRSLTSEKIQNFTEPERSEFTDKNPYHALDDFFQTLNPVLLGRSLIIAIDEFEKIEEKIEKGQLSENLLEFFRGLTQTYPWFSLVFAGLHTLEEMCYSYWHPFFTSIPIRVSFLPCDAAEQLIMQANNITYEDEVISQIVRLTNGQPYLIQLIGHTLIAYLNRNLLSQRKPDSTFPIFNSEDLQKVLDSPEFYSIGNAYFRGIWQQAFTSSVPGQIEILKQLAMQQMSAEQLTQATGFPTLKVASALKILQEHDVVIFKDSSYTYTVELMRKWVVSSQYCTLRNNSTNNQR